VIRDTHYSEMLKNLRNDARRKLKGINRSRQRDQMMIRKFCLALTFAGFVPCAIPQDHYEWQEKLKSLDKKCEDARAVKLAPIRKHLARECAADRRRSMSLKECEMETATYGNNMAGALGATIIGLYYDLPECTAAAEDRKEREAAKTWNR
jgi:hypothetical protein